MNACIRQASRQRRTVALAAAALLGFAVGTSSAAAATTVRHDPDSWVFLDNGTIRLGVDTNAGGCIAFFGESATGRNLLNSYDLGRYIAQSYYGGPDGSRWDAQPWRWNPVQGGDWRGNPTKLLVFTRTATNLHSRTLPKHWASGEDIPELVMEQWITLAGRTARIRYQAVYSGATNHASHHQELPALYFDNALSNFVYYTGDAPWTGGPLVRRTPGPKNEYVQRPEQWTACVDAADWGVGVLTPGTTRMTCFFIPGPGGPKGSGCSYFAPIRTMAVTNGFRFAYDMHLTIGTSAQIRDTFRALAADAAGGAAAPP